LRYRSSLGLSKARGTGPGARGSGWGRPDRQIAVGPWKRTEEAGGAWGAGTRMIEPLCSPVASALPASAGVRGARRLSVATKIPEVLGGGASPARGGSKVREGGTCGRDGTEAVGDGRVRDGGAWHIGGGSGRGVTGGSCRSRGTRGHSRRKIFRVGVTPAMETSNKREDFFYNVKDSTAGN
jgi:hypothetical protein